MICRMAVYELLVAGVVVYVGVSKDPHKRFHWHKARRKVPRHAELRIVRWYNDRDKAFSAEARRIMLKSPSGNTLHHAGLAAARREDAQRKKEAAYRAKVEAEIASYQARLARYSN